MTYDTRYHVGPEIGPNYEPGGLLFVGRDPGFNEVQQGRPFVGKSGGVFDAALTQAGLRRSEVAIANRVPQKPWSNNFAKHSNAVIAAGLRDLAALVDRLEPGLIVALGNEACYDLVPDWSTLAASESNPHPGGRTIRQAKGIMDRRGYMWPASTLGPPVLACLHPANAVYQELPNRVLINADFEKAADFIAGRRPFTPFPDVGVVETSADIRHLYNHDLVSFDIEVKWGGTDLLCIAFCGDDMEPVVAFEDRLETVRPLLTSPAVHKVAHNGSFDDYVLQYQCNLPVRGHVEDTIHLWWALYPELAGKSETGREEFTRKRNEITRKGLSFLASLYLNVPFWKEYTNDPARMGILCGNDVYATRALFDAMWPEVEEFDVEAQYRRSVEMIPILNAMQNRGILIDRDLWDERRRQLKTRHKKHKARAKEAGTRFLQEHDIREHLWYRDRQCPCCNGGSIKSQHCDSCAGIEGSGKNGALLKDDLVQWVAHNVDPFELGTDPRSLKKDELLALLPPCSECTGQGTVPEWDFNPLSSAQLTLLLYDHLDVPKYTLKGSKPNAQESTLRRVLVWSEGGYEKGVIK